MPIIPEQYLKHLQQQSLSFDDTELFCAVNQLPLQKSIRFNTLKAQSNELAQHMKKKGWQLKAIPWCKEGYWIEPTDQHNDIIVGHSVEHFQGLFYIQEASSMLPVSALFDNGYSPNLVLDMSAAPGSKTTQIAAEMNGEGFLVANEISSSRIKTLHHNVQRCGIRNIGLTQMDGRRFGSLLPNTFDAILLDAPCGGEGTIRKDPDALKDWNVETLKEMSSLQKELIASAYASLAPGGRLVYSTCTLSAEENQQVCDYLLSIASDLTVNSLEHLFPAAEKSLTREGYLLVYPQTYDTGGFFVASFQKAKTSIEQPEPIVVNSSSLHSKSRFQPINKKLLTLILNYFQQNFEIDLTHEIENLFLKDDDIWLLPKQSMPLSHLLKFQRAGIKVCEIKKQKVSIAHEFIHCHPVALSHDFLELNPEQCIQFVQGRDIDIPPQAKKDVIVGSKFGTLGWVKPHNNRFKNKLLRHLVLDTPHCLL